jgi:hypothetical protein
METKPQSNKSSFRSEALNIHFFHKGMMYKDQYGIMFGPTKGHANPPLSREELKGLADFIYNYLENN